MYPTTGYTAPISSTAQARAICNRLSAVVGKSDAAVIVRLLLDKYGFVCADFVRDLDEKTRQVEHDAQAQK